MRCRRLSDGERDILAEQNRDATPAPGGCPCGADADPETGLCPDCRAVEEQDAANGAADLAWWERECRARADHAAGADLHPWGDDEIPY
jgi:hypothetical protein